MSYDYDILIKSEKVKNKTINLHKVGYDEGSYSFIVNFGENGLFDEKIFNDIEEANSFFEEITLKWNNK